MSRMNRRDFLRATVVVVGATALGLPLMGCDGDGGDDDYFPQSVASGDPKPSSVILWSRVANDGAQDSDGNIPVTVEVATDSGFKNLVAQASLSAMEAHDHCVKAKVVGLSSWTTYYYRFSFLDAHGNRHFSRTGTTKTAPASDQDVEVKFGLVVCQDYIDGYFNAYAMLLERDPDLDFILHTGDYIYEYDRGTGMEGADIEARLHGFASLAEDDVVTLRDGSHTARSLENYRYLYKTYHSDSKMKEVHENYPMINIWDDHEFSDDCHGATGTYYNGREDETDIERRRNSEQAFFEYLPYDEDYADTYTATGLEDTPLNDLYSDDNAGRGCYRTLRFGRNFEMFLSDYRTYRPDHLVPEDTFPGAVLMDQDIMIAFFESVYPGQGAVLYAAQASSFDPYLDLTDMPAAYSAYASSYQAASIGTLTYAYVVEGLSEEDAQAKATSDLSGKVSASIFNSLIESYNDAADADQQLPVIDDTTIASLPTGLTCQLLGKSSFFSSTGARYGMAKATFDIYAAYMAGGAAEDVFGEAQQDEIDAFIAGSDATYIGFVSSVSTANMIWDLSSYDLLAPYFNTQFYANVDGWDGFPNRRTALLTALQTRGKAIVLSGDIHASYLTKWDVLDTGASCVADFTCSSISSTVFNDFVNDTVNTGFVSLLTEDQLALANNLLVDNLDATLQAGFAANNNANSAFSYCKTKENGYVALTVNADGVTGVFRTFPHTQAKTKHYDDLTALDITEATFFYDGADLTEV